MVSGPNFTSTWHDFGVITNFVSKGFDKKSEHQRNHLLCFDIWELGQVNNLKLNSLFHMGNFWLPTNLQLIDTIVLKLR